MMTLPQSIYKTQWKHEKSGGLYWVQHIGLIESSLEPVVIYQSIEGGPFWVRPVYEFFDGRFSQQSTFKDEE